jgi:hypothetical protein
VNDYEAELRQYHELRAYSLAHRDPNFLHQHVVDAFAAQCANERTKPITLTFALVGLYLHVEKKQTGLQGPTRAYAARTTSNELASLRSTRRQRRRDSVPYDACACRTRQEGND